MIQLPARIAPFSIQTNLDAAKGYAELTQDFNPIHLDADFARSTVFGRPIAHGTMALNLIVEALSRATKDAFYITELDIRFSAPTYIGQTLTGAASQEEGALYRLEATSDDGRLVLTGTARLAARVLA
ncbi:MAG: MaoC family dehydratase [Paracoccaceae bacterium]